MEQQRLRPARSSITLPPLNEKKAITNESLPQINNNNNISNNNDDTQNYLEDMKKGTYNILVCIRCRPLSQLELQISNYETIKIMEKKIVVLMDPIEYNGPNSIFKNRSREQTYAFDFAFDKYTTQKTVFENSTKFLLEGVVNGFNSTVFAYGATGAGKTYTMLGNDNNPGIMPMTLIELFNQVNKYSDREYKLKLWYLEIYNENIRDLLKFTNPNNTNDEYLDLREDPTKGIIVNNITELNVTSSEDILKILKKGNRNRTQESTGANETSSRSHAILQINIEYYEKNQGINVEIKYSKLSLIDLAGSERASATQNRGIRLIEGANINRSLLTLGNCINALCDAVNKGIKKPYIPYRDSKLTRLLKDSLGGNSRTVMIANIAPSINTFDDTNNTLKYANRAKNIKTYVTRNVLNAQYHISNYVNIINGLKQEVQELKNKLNNVMCQNGNQQNSLINQNNNILLNQNTNVNNNNNNNNNNIQNNNNNVIFNNAVKEMKEICEKQVSLKQRIISEMIEIDKLNDIIEMNNNINNVNNDISTILNKTDINNLENINPPNAITQSYNDRLNLLQSTLNSNKNKLQQFSTLIDRNLTNYIKNNFDENQMDYLKSIVKTAQQRIIIIDNKYLNNLTKAKFDIKDEYISQLENQLKIRDEYFLNQKINIYQNSKFKSLDELQNEYSKKNPIIKSYSNNQILPPINHSSSQNYSFINNKYSNPQLKKIKNIISKRKSPNKNEQKNLIRNFSQNLKNSNLTTPTRKKRRISNVIRNNSNKGNLLNLYKKNSPSSNRVNSKGHRNKSAMRISPNQKNNNLYIKNIATQMNNNHSRDNSLVDNSFFGNNNISLIVKNSSSSTNRLITIDQIPQFKKSDLNIALNERNKKRQKFLDKINGVNDKDML